MVKHGVLHSGTIRLDPRSNARTSLFLDADGPAVAKSDDVADYTNGQAEETE